MKYQLYSVLVGTWGPPDNVDPRFWFWYVCNSFMRYGTLPTNNNSQPSRLRKLAWISQLDIWKVPSIVGPKSTRNENQRRHLGLNYQLNAARSTNDCIFLSRTLLHQNFPSDCTIENVENLCVHKFILVNRGVVSLVNIYKKVVQCCCIRIESLLSQTIQISFF